MLLKKYLKNRNRLIDKREENADRAKAERIKKYDFSKQLLPSLTQVKN